ncbi:hypothetical protein D3C75_708870 [compost metagenome]
MLFTMTPDAKTLQRLPHRMAGGQAEQRFHLCLIAAVADGVRGTAAPGNKTQRIDNDRFPGAGLPRKYMKTRIKMHIYRLNNGKIADRQGF